MTTRTFSVLFAILSAFCLGIIYHQTIEISMMRDMITKHDTAIRINQTLMQGRLDCLGTQPPPGRKF